MSVSISVNNNNHQVTRTDLAREAKYRMFVVDSWDGYDKTKLDFNVTSSPLEVNGFKIPDKKALFRADTDKPVYLATVSSNYPVIKHSDIIAKIEDGMNFKNANVRTILTKNGSVMTRMYTLKDYSVEVRPGDEISPIIRVINSYDGSNAIGFYIDAVRLVCTNGMIATRQFMSMSYKHFGGRFNINEFAKNASELIKGFEDYSLNWRQWIKAPVTESRANLLIDYMPKRIRPMVQSRMENNFDYTKWGFYNAFTEALTHDYTPSRAINNDEQKIKLGAGVTKMFATPWYWDASDKDIKADLNKRRKIEVTETETNDVIETSFIK